MATTAPNWPCRNSEFTAKFLGGSFFSKKTGKMAYGMDALKKLIGWCQCRVNIKLDFCKVVNEPVKYGT